MELVHDLPRRKAPRVIGVEYALNGNLAPSAANPYVGVQWALLAGDDVTGITLSTFNLDERANIISGTYRSIVAESVDGSSGVFRGGYAVSHDHGIFVPPLETIIPFDTVTLFAVAWGTTAGALQISVRVHYDLKTVRGDDLYALTLLYS
jgi:hypothetical protein